MASTNTTASKIFEDSLIDVLNPSKSQQAAKVLILEIQNYNNSELTLQNAETISKIFSLFVEEPNIELLRLITLCVLNGYRQFHQDALDVIMSYIRVESPNEESHLAAYSLCILFHFMDIPFGKKLEIRELLKTKSLKASKEELKKSCHISHMASLTYQEYLRTIGIQERTVPDVWESHENHLEALRCVLQELLKDGYNEHVLFNRAVISLMDGLKNEATDREEDGYVVVS